MLLPSKYPKSLCKLKSKSETHLLLDFRVSTNKTTQCKWGLGNPALAPKCLESFSQMSLLEFIPEPPSHPNQAYLPSGSAATATPLFWATSSGRAGPSSRLSVFMLFSSLRSGFPPLPSISAGRRWRSGPPFSRVLRPHTVPCSGSSDQAQVHVGQMPSVFQVGKPRTNFNSSLSFKAQIPPLSCIVTLGKPSPVPSCLFGITVKHSLQTTDSLPLRAP